MTTLAIGIGANTAIFSVIYAVLLAPLPYPEPDQLVMVWSKVQGNRNIASAGDFLDWKRQNTVFQDLTAWTNEDFNLATSGWPERVGGGLVTPGLINMTQHDLFLGRDFTSEEGTPGREHVVIMMAFAVAQRTHEIGVRMALGAGRDQVLRMVLKEGVVLALFGLGLGLIGACLVGRALRGVFYGIGSVDPPAFCAVAATLLAAALLACYIPALRATKVDPVVALRYE